MNHDVRCAVGDKVGEWPKISPLQLHLSLGYAGYGSDGRVLRIDRPPGPRPLTTDR